MADDWNTLAGDLRSALAHNERGLAGRAIWKLKQLDRARYSVEFEEYTRKQLNQGEDMALATEQRLEAVRQWARAGAQFFGDDSSARKAWLFMLRVLAMGQPYHLAAAKFTSDMEHLHYRDFEGFTFSRDHLRIYGYIETRDNTRTIEPVAGLECACLDFEGGWDDDGLNPLREDMRDVLWLELQELKTG